MTEQTQKPAYQILQEEWNRLVPFAQAANIPRIRTIRVGPGITYRDRKARLEALRTQLRAAVGDARFEAIISGQAKAPDLATARVLRLDAKQDTATALSAATQSVMDDVTISGDGLPVSPMQRRWYREQWNYAAKCPPAYMEASSKLSPDEADVINELGLVVLERHPEFYVLDPVVRRHFAFRDASRRGQYRGRDLPILLEAAREVRATMVDGVPERIPEEAAD